MNRFGRYFSIAMLLTTVAFSHLAAEATLAKGSHKSISSVQSDAVFLNMEELLGDVQKEFEATRQKMSQEAQLKMEKFQKEQKDLEAKKADMKKETYDKKEGALKGEQQAYMQEFQTKMMAEQQKAAKKAEDRMKEVEKVRVKYGWKAVFPTGSAIAFDKSLDVTSIVKKELKQAQCIVPDTSNSKTSRYSSRK